MKSTVFALVLAAVSVSSAHAEMLRATGKVVTESQLKLLSDMQYFSLLQGAYASGWRYSASDVRSGMKRNLDEWRARFIDDGYSIIPDGTNV